jgi:isoleucyl-tRNA synthetase
MTVSDEIFKRVADTYRRIRNTARFMLANLNGFDPSKNSVTPDSMIAIDRWIVRQCQTLQKELIAHYQDYNFLNIYQKIHNFCVIQLGGFYLDVIKDRQYTTQVDSLARRSTQTAMYHILEMLCRLIAPILSYTADEIWDNIPGDREDSVFLSDFSDGVSSFAESTEFPDEFWERIMEIKTAVNKELESGRAEKRLGSGLSAEVDLFCDEELTNLLSRLEGELRFVLIVSRASVKSIENADSNSVQTEINGLKLQVTASDYKKCERCWHHHSDVGKDKTHPSLCQRCINNIEGQGEQRNFA